MADGSISKNITVETTISAVKAGNVTLMNGEVGFTATLIGQDAEHDLALLKPSSNPLLQQAISINGVDPLPKPHQAFLCSRTLRLRSGDPVFTIGHPLGYFRKVTTTGIIASSESVGTDCAGDLAGTYLVDMLINHGNSGGPVFSQEGCVIGMADSIALRGIEGSRSDKKPFDGIPSLTLVGPDNKPLMDSNNRPVSVALTYSSGLGTLIPQQYIIKLLDQQGFHSSADDKPANGSAHPP